MDEDELVVVFEIQELQFVVLFVDGIINMNNVRTKKLKIFFFIFFSLLNICILNEYKININYKYKLSYNIYSGLYLTIFSNLIFFDFKSKIQSYL